MKFKKFLICLCALAMVSAVAPHDLKYTADLVSSAVQSETRTGVCNADVLNVRKGAGTSYSKVSQITFGTVVSIIGSAKDSNGDLWYKITVDNGSSVISGYVWASYISLSPSDEASSDKSFEADLTKQGFPESYKPYLRKLHEQHPKWVFKAQHITPDWNKVVEEECVLGRNLVHGSALASWKSMEKGAYNFSDGYWYGLDGSWVAASKEIIMYYLDPRNFLDDTYIFMFENLSYSPSVQNISGVKAILNGTFMNGNYTCPDTGRTYSYAQTFMDAAEKSGVSPYHLASRCRNEQGIYGAPQSLGTVPGYKNYFNFFDVQAYATSTMTAAQMGCKYAMTTNPTYLLPWTNQYKSIVGGAIFVGTGYISKEQDTLYLQKFDVVDGGNGMYYHQYMTCVFGQANEAVSLKNAYSSQVLNSAMEFKIPVYKNMPENLCPKPTSSGDNNNYLKSFSISGESISPNFDKFTNSYKASVDSSVTSVTINAQPLGKYASVSGTGKVNLKVGENTFNIVCTAASGVKRTYTVKITRKAPSNALQQGDVNGDKQLTVVDALLVLKYSAGKTSLTSEQLLRADMDNNGTVDVMDALKILQKVSGKS